MSVRERWIGLLQRAATGTKRTRSLLTPVGVLVFGVFTALFVVVAVLVDGLLRLPKPLPDDALEPSELILPPADASIDEVRGMLGDSGLIPG